MKAIVHIGAPKTGSSTIQEFLFRNTDALAAQGVRFHRNVPGRGSQFEYPLAALAALDRLLPGREEQTRYSSTDLATHKATGAAIMAGLAEVRATWAEPVALFSSEHVYPWIVQPDEIRALDALFAPHFDEVRYVLYIRNQDDLIVSEYSEVLKRGSNQRLQTFVDQRLKSLDWEPRIRNWVKVLGRDRFDLRTLDREHLVGHDLLTDFAAACGFALEGTEVPPRINESLSAAAAECLRMMNERIPQLLHDGGPNPLRNGLVWNLMRLTPEGAPPLALTPEQRAQVQAVVGNANERLRADFFSEREALFTGPSKRQPAARDEVMEDALDLAARLFIRLRMGRMAALDEGQRKISVQRTRGGVSNGIAAPPKKA